MRISVHPNDPGFVVYERLPAGNVDVYLDGEKCEYALTADEEEGFVETLEINGEGVFVMDPNDPDELAILVRRGKVEIRITPDDTEAGNADPATDRQVAQEGSRGLVGEDLCGTVSTSWYSRFARFCARAFLRPRG